MFKYIGLIIVLIVIFTSVATAAQAWLNPSDDACIVQYYPDTNYGSYNLSWIGTDYSEYLNTLVRFDLSSYSGVIVESSYLWLYVGGSGGTFPPNGTFFGMCDASWNESTVTWNTRPSYVYWDYISGPSSIAAWWVIDVTGYVADWVGGVHANYGFQLGAVAIGDDWFNVHTKENADDPPWLELNYHYAAIQSTSLGNIKAIFE